MVQQFGLREVTLVAPPPLCGPFTLARTGNGESEDGAAGGGCQSPGPGCRLSCKGGGGDRRA